MAAPMRVGILNDMSEAAVWPGELERWMRLCVEDLARAGRLDREVEFVLAAGMGLPSGTAAAVEKAFAELAAQDVLLIVGPAIGDNALVATPLAERRRIPTLNWAGAERARGDYMFHLQVGSHEDESVVLARHLAASGSPRVGVIYDRSPIGRRHLHFLQLEAEVLGLSIVASASVSPLAQAATAEVDQVLAGGADAVVYLGLGLSAPPVAGRLRESGFTGPCAMNTAGLRGYWGDYARQVEGWTYVDMRADENRTLQALCARLGVEGEASLAAAKGHDLARLTVEALARAPERTRDGVKEGLEQIKWLPAAEGHEGTLLGFGVQDRGALHGRYLVLRQWREGRSVQVSG